LLPSQLTESVADAGGIEPHRANVSGSTLWDQIDSTELSQRAPTEPVPARLDRVLIVGSGLIGTSIALALREQGVDVVLEDSSAGRLALAVELGAGRPREESDRFDLAVVAVPPDAVATEVQRIQRLNLSRTYTDVASSKAQPLAELQLAGADMSTFLGSHPVAGREQQGPAAAHADLFVGRPWVLTPTSVGDHRDRRFRRPSARGCLWRERRGDVG
jgi:hypothetical protein